MSIILLRMLSDTMLAASFHAFATDFLVSGVLKFSGMSVDGDDLLNSSTLISEVATALGVSIVVVTSVVVLKVVVFVTLELDIDEKWN